MAVSLKKDRGNEGAVYKIDFNLASGSLLSFKLDVTIRHISESKCGSYKQSSQLSISFSGLKLKFKLETFE